MKIHEFMEETRKLKKVDGEDLYAICRDAQNAIVDFCVKKQHNPKFEKQTTELFDRMSNKRVIKAFKKLAKNKELDPGFAFAGDCLVNKVIHNEDLEKDDVERILLGYGELRELLLKSKVKELCKKSGLPKEVVIELLSIVPESQYLSEARYVEFYTRKLMRKLYMMAKDSENFIEDSAQLEKVFKYIFGKKFIDIIAVFVLLERKTVINNFNENQKKVFNKLSVFALKVLEKQEKKHRRELIDYYIKKRLDDVKNNRDEARRLNLGAVTDDVYPKIAKTVSKIKEDEDKAKYL